MTGRHAPPPPRHVYAALLGSSVLLCAAGLTAIAAHRVAPHVAATVTSPPTVTGTTVPEITAETVTVPAPTTVPSPVVPSVTKRTHAQPISVHPSRTSVPLASHTAARTAIPVPTPPAVTAQAPAATTTAPVTTTAAPTTTAAATTTTDLPLPTLPAPLTAEETAP